MFYSISIDETREILYDKICVERMLNVTGKGT